MSKRHPHHLHPRRKSQHPSKITAGVTTRTTRKAAVTPPTAASQLCRNNSNSRLSLLVVLWTTTRPTQRQVISMKKSARLRRLPPRLLTARSIRTTTAAATMLSLLTNKPGRSKHTRTSARSTTAMVTVVIAPVHQCSSSNSPAITSGRRFRLEKLVA